jgi:hypothetical protein
MLYHAARNTSCPSPLLSAFQAAASRAWTKRVHALPAGVVVNNSQHAQTLPENFDGAGPSDPGSLRLVVHAWQLEMATEYQLSAWTW